ncbi:ATP-binding protein [Gaopeijia maritima]|uniref:ATP-binding protein n=1 Tax=Gaopeijia maritima TaxID=3119007 RepID=UPI00386DA1A8
MSLATLRMCRLQRCVRVVVPSEGAHVDYRSRIADGELVRRLDATGAVVIEGPKACGKTATARQQAASEVLLDVDETARKAVGFDPGLVLAGPTPRLIDEWQVEPAIWNHVRRAIDDRQTPGQFILTGSAVPADDATRHTGAGRLTRLRMRPMSLFESGASTGAISLRAALSAELEGGSRSELEADDLFELLCVGGWPGHLHRSMEAALQSNRDYLEEVRRVDISRVDGVARDPERVGRFIRSYARNTATNASMATIAADTAGDDGVLRNHTALEYAEALMRLMIVEDQPAWAPHLRSKSVLRQAPKRHLVDPSLAVAALRTGPDKLRQDLELFGFLFESMVVRDLRVYAQAADADVYHYRDNTGLEVDAVVASHAGPWAAFEVKLGGERWIEQGAETLLRFRDRVDADRSGEPALLAVIVGSGTYAHRRADGVWVLPIGVCGP